MLLLINLTEVKAPYTVCFNVDWPGEYIECWRLTQLQQSRSAIDLVLQIVNKEYSKMQMANAAARADYEEGAFEALDDLQ